MKKIKFKAISSINDTIDRKAKLKAFINQINDDFIKKELKVFNRFAFTLILLLSINISQNQISFFYKI